MKWDGRRPGLGRSTRSTSSATFSPRRTGTTGASSRSPPRRSREGWFLHAMTGHEAYLKLVFRVARHDRSSRTSWQPQLALRAAVSDTPGPGRLLARRPTASRSTNWPRAMAVGRDHRPQEGRDRHAGVPRVPEAGGRGRSRAGSTRLQAGVEDVDAVEEGRREVAPGRQGVPARQGREVGPGTCCRGCSKLLREVDPTLEVKWDVRDAVTLRLPGSRRGCWARLKTKEPAALECWFVGKPGQFNLSRVEGIGRRPRRSRATGPTAASAEAAVRHRGPTSRRRS